MLFFWTCIYVCIKASSQYVFLTLMLIKSIILLSPKNIWALHDQVRVFSKASPSKTLTFFKFDIVSWMSGLKSPNIYFSFLSNYISSVFAACSEYWDQFFHLHFFDSFGPAWVLPFLHFICHESNGDKEGVPSPLAHVCGEGGRGSRERERRVETS